MRNKIIAQAKAWLGKNERDGSFQVIIDTYNQIYPLPVGYKVKYSDEWCAAFISAVAQACGLTDVVLPECGTERMIKLYKAVGGWVEQDDYVPRPGDLLMYDWQDTGVGDCTGTADHVAFVEKVENGIIHLIEGNRSQSVMRTTLPINGKTIRGFCVPKYQDLGVAEPVPEQIPVGDTTVGFSNSPLANEFVLNNNHYGLRPHRPDHILIHCMVGQATAHNCGKFFQRGSWSSNYGIGFDGQIALYVEEKYAPKCTSDSDIDKRGISIEVASDTFHPYAVTPAAYEALIRLVADICRRNGIKKLLWEGNPALIGNIARQNMAVHRWFDAKACPGDYLFNRHGDIANRVNTLLGATSAPAPTPEPVPTPTPGGNKIVYRIQVSAHSTKAAAETAANRFSGIKAHVVQSGNVFRVQLGDYNTREEALAEKVQRGLGGFITQVQIEAPPAPPAPSPGPTVGAILPVVQSGQQGSAVKTVQLLLIHKHGIGVGSSGADGIFGVATSNGVKLFQSKKGLPQTGVVDYPTWQALLV